jgi:RNA polymerase sigma factor for flagellar operon FliA
MGNTVDAWQLALWQRWRLERDPAARECLTSHFLSHARMIAAVSYARRTHDDIHFDEYLQLASIGLIEAVDRFDPALGVQFKTYATKRIQGAILSGLERLTEKNQQIAALKRLRQERLDSLKERRNLGEAENAGVGSDLKMDPANIQSQKDLFSYLAEISVALALGVLLEGSGMVHIASSEEQASDVTPEVSYFRKTEMIQLGNMLRDLMDHLTPQEQTVIRCHYFQELPFEEIATMFAMSKSRVSQLHRLGLKKLRERLACRTSCDISL